ncbi:MAG TPA: prolyl oligopeptidase family serine peptidase [Phnomibacter sp.]|nr:prolyl oligopeptidase family serine peptidase [Phnomibacter sp.]
MKQIFVMATLITAMQVDAQITYPKTAKGTQTDNYHGKTVADPYRWLEDDNSADTKAWVVEENAVTEKYLAGIPFRQQVKDRLTELWNYPKYGSPFKKGAYYYFSKNDGLQNQSIIYRQKGLDGKPETFLDPNKLSADGTAALGGLSFSQHHKYVGYMVAQSGSDWQEAFVMDAATGKKLEDQIGWIKFSGLAWKGDEGFYYSRYPKPSEENTLKGKNEFHQVWYHAIGTKQENDVLIYEDKAHPLRTAFASVTEDGRFLLINTSEGTSGAEIWVKNLVTGANDPFTLLIKGFDTEAGVVDNVGDQLLVHTNADATNYKVVLIDPQNADKAHWKTIIAEKPEMLESVGTGGGYLFANYLKDASTSVLQVDYSGKLKRTIQLPGIGTATGFGGEKEDKEFFYTYTSFTQPPTIYRYDVGNGKSDLFRKAEVKFNPEEYETKQVFFSSTDGKKVPIFISYKKGIKLDGKNPVIMYGYGGFNIPITPAFSISNLFFMEQGGIYASVNLRGGNEYGEAWHKAGMLENKQQVFDDFIAAGEYLIREKYTSKERLAIRGGSNGGLLVGACMTQRPDLFKVALPAVGVLDMLRYHKFTIGWAWVVEYGSADNAQQFPNLYKYSPLHNLKDGTAYPATLITTADHDDRVVPAHSFKFAARLQEAHKGNNPVLIRIESKAGHGAGKPTSKQIEESTDILSFTMYNLGMRFK